MCCVPVGLDAEVTILTKGHCTIQERQTVIPRIRPRQIDVLVHSIYLLSESLQFLSFLIWIHVSSTYPNQWLEVVPVKEVQSPFLHFLHVAVGHDGGHWRTHGTAVFTYK